jgi:hypothetical protein
MTPRIRIDRPPYYAEYDPQRQAFRLGYADATGPFVWLSIRQARLLVDLFRQVLPALAPTEEEANHATV